MKSQHRSVRKQTSSSEIWGVFGRQRRAGNVFCSVQRRDDEAKKGKKTARWGQTSLRSWSSFINISRCLFLRRKRTSREARIRGLSNPFSSALTPPPSTDRFSYRDQLIKVRSQTLCEKNTTDGRNQQQRKRKKVARRFSFSSRESFFGFGRLRDEILTSNEARERRFFRPWKRGKEKCQSSLRGGKFLSFRSDTSH